MEDKNGMFIGKTIKVFTNELTFGKVDRQVNVVGLFKYKKNTTTYVVYADIDEKLNIIYYATAHVKNNNILTLDAKKEEDMNAIKEYVFKVTNKESLDDYEMISISDVDSIEIIGFSKLEVKPEVFNQMIELTIPKVEKKEETQVVKKKKSPIKMILYLIFVAVLCYGAYLFVTSPTETTAIVKTISCVTSYNHDELPAVVYEEKVFNFNNALKLENVDITESFVFNDEDEYFDFVNEGVYFKYKPTNDENGAYNLIDEELTFKRMSKEEIDDDFKDPTDYEELLSFYKSLGYTCEESDNQ